MQAALGFAWYDLNQFEEASKALLRALKSQDRFGKVPIAVVEKLVNSEARLGEQNNDPLLISGAIQRLDGLDLAGLGDIGNPERWALRGSAYKRIAAVAARALLQAVAVPTALDAAETAEVRRVMRDALENSAAAYAAAEGGRDGRPLVAYLALNRLALDALLHGSVPPDGERIALARACAEVADASFAVEANFWDAIASAEAKLVEALLDGSLLVEGAAGDAALDALLQTYRETLRSVTVKPAELDSVIVQMDLLARLLDALASKPGGANTARPSACAGLPSAWARSAPRHSRMKRRPRPLPRRLHRCHANAPAPGEKKARG